MRFKVAAPIFGFLLIVQLADGCYAQTPAPPIEVSAGPVLVAPTVVETVDQGVEWTDDDRRAFYRTDQGSRMIPLRWAEALRNPDGTPFLSNNLRRYGYLKNEFANKLGIPVGFTVSSDLSGNGPVLGMTCSACHTREIRHAGTTYRVDGGPAFADFQGLLADLDAAVGRVLGNNASFDNFAKDVLGANAKSAERDALKKDVAAWYHAYHSLISRALPKEPWGIGRLDAVGMILNRLTGLDIGTSPDRLILENIREAAAPVRYPFLWNAPKQDKTQWPGIADNGSDLLGLARNIGEVYGVFAIFHPKKEILHVLGVDYTEINSADFNGLDDLEVLIKQIGPPQWPGPLDKNLAAAGAKVFDRPTGQGGCVECHGIVAGVTRFYNQKTWRTLIQDVGTDSKQYELLKWTAKTGVLEGARIPFLTEPLTATDSSLGVLRLAVVGSILQHYVPILMATGDPAQEKSFFTADTQDLKGVYVPSQVPTNEFAYESRVMEGIWAAAPYLHNGSVPSLAELLKPAKYRVTSFEMGADYDFDTVGIALKQSQLYSRIVTTDCSKRNSGNSNCGHEFGTTLSESDKKALLEFLKSL